MKSASPPAHGLAEGKEYSLKLGSSFQSGARAQESYHVLRYDFKPASIDTSQPAEVKFGSNKECFVTYPNHDQGSITFKGGRKPCQKECILIIDKTSGEITLERISSNIPLKKSRTGTVDRSGDIRKSGTSGVVPPNPKHKAGVKHHGSKATNETSSSSQPSNPSSSSQQNESSSHTSSHPATASQPTHHHKHNVHKQPAPKTVESKPKNTSGSSSSDSSSDSDSSDSDSDLEEHAKALDSCIAAPYDPPPTKQNEPPPPPIATSNKGSNVLQDLQLSDSNSDSDSD